MPSSSSGRARQASRGPPSAYRISRVARRPGGPYRLRATSTVLRCPTTSRPRRIQPERRSSRRRPLASSTAAARLRPRLAGSSTTRSVPARRASAASLPSRSPTRFPATAGSRPSGRSMTSRSTVRAASSAPARASASSRSTGVRTTSHSGRTPRATASTGSKARARSSHATIAPPACASAAVRSATVVLPEDAAPRNATVAARGSPPGPRMASSAANPVGTMRPSASGAGVPGRRVTTGARGVGARGSGVERVRRTGRVRRDRIRHRHRRPREGALGRQHQVSSAPWSGRAPAGLEGGECLGDVGCRSHRTSNNRTSVLLVKGRIAAARRDAPPESTGSATPPSCHDRPRDTSRCQIPGFCLGPGARNRRNRRPPPRVATRNDSSASRRRAPGAPGGDRESDRESAREAAGTCVLHSPAGPPDPSGAAPVGM